jgi:hypothetical protein
VNPEQALKNKKRRRQLLIYGGIAAGLLLAVLLSRRGSQKATQAPDQPAVDPTGGAAAPAGSSGGDPLGAGGSVDNSAQLAGFESALLDQLPTAISSSIMAGMANAVPPNGDGVSAGDTPPAAAGTTVNVYSAPAKQPRGTGHAGAHRPGKQKGKQNRKGTHHPAVTRGGGGGRGGSHAPVHHAAPAPALPNRPTGHHHKHARRH